MMLIYLLFCLLKHKSKSVDDFVATTGVALLSFIKPHFFDLAGV
jgi:hypothetical protein